MEAKHLSNSQPARQAPANSPAESIINMLDEQPAVVKVTDDTALSLLKPPSCLFPLLHQSGCAQTDMRLLFIYNGKFVRWKKGLLGDEMR